MYLHGKLKSKGGREKRALQEQLQANFQAQ
jgi:hypothetical protein